MLGIKSIKNIDEIKEQIRNFEKFIRNSDVTDETIELCLIKVRQLAQAVEQMSSTKATVEEPKQQKGEERVDVSSLISIINKI